MKTEKRSYSKTEAANMVEACVEQIGKLCGIIAEASQHLDDADAGIEVGAEILNQDREAEGTFLLITGKERTARFKKLYEAHQKEELGINHISYSSDGVQLLPAGWMEIEDSSSL